MCFAIRRGDVERLDPKFVIYGGHLQLHGTTASTLGKLVTREPDYGAPFRSMPREADEVKYIRVTDFGDFGIPDGHLFVTAETIDDRFLLEEGDMLFARSGATAGKTFLYREALGPAIFAGYCIRFKFDSHKVLPEFVYLYTKTKRYSDWVRSIQRPSGQPNINKEEFKSFTIPVPNIDEQLRLVADLDAARVLRQEKLAEADTLLEGIDSYVLGTIGLGTEKLKRSPVFAVRLKEAHVRIDPDFNTPSFQMTRCAIEHGKFPAQPVSMLFYPLLTGFAAGANSQTEDPSIGIPHIRPLNITNEAQLTLEDTKMIPRLTAKPEDLLKTGEILFNNTNSTAWVGKTVVFDLEKDCACSNHITRLTLIVKTNNPYYFAAIFNALRSIGYFGLLATNFNNQAGVNNDTLKGVLLPVPPSYETQTNIAKEVARCRNEARRLRNKAQTLWESALRNFEEQLLGLSTNEAKTITDNQPGGGGT